MDSLLNAIDNAHPIHLPKPENSTKRNMSIESMLNSDATFEHKYNQHHRSPCFNSISNSSSPVTSTPTTVKRPWLSATYDDRLHKHRRHENEFKPPPLQQPHTPKRMTTITCLHAAVAQKSYGSEKRFLCPPPTIAIQHHHQHATLPTITMSVLAEGNERSVEQRTSLDENNNGNFKYLHVTGSAKTKQFCLRVNMFHLSTPNTSATQTSGVNMNGPPFATFFSSPISIISKPSKKTAKARNVSSCIFTTSQISLFNRINSQTVRTKYLTSASSSDSHEQQQKELCAKNSSWSAFDIILVRQPTPPPQHTLSHNHHHYHHHHQPSVATAGVPLTYGTEIILKDSQSGVCSQPVIIRKVDKGAISPDAFGPVSQMQKIALQLASSVDSSDGSVYLSANGNAIQEANKPCQDLDETNNNVNGNSSGNGVNHTHASTWLDYCVSKRVPDSKNKDGACLEKVDDYLCWTIVGIAKFEYTIEEPIAPTAGLSPPIASPSSPTSPLSPIASSSPPPSFYNTHRPNDIASPPYQNSNSNKYHHSRQQDILPRLLQPSPPPSPPRTIVPFPMVSSVSYVEKQHTLDLVGQHLVQHLPGSAYPHLLEFWLGGAHGPLPSIQQQHQHSVTNGNIELSLTLPHTQDFLVAHHDLLVNKNPQGDRLVELPLLMVRKDNVVYHSGKSVACHVKSNGDTHWTIVDVTVAK
ncbi:unnamed protein product [Absidia cylindrospora]